MSITRRDTIILAIFINTALLTILFFTAIKPEIQKEKDGITEKEPIVLQQEKVIEVSTHSSMTSKSFSNDEVDDVLKEYVSKEHEAPVIALNQNASETQEKSETLEPSSSPQNLNDLKEIEVTVKKGDSLEKIARANRSTIEGIKKANQLSSDRLSVGQVLKVPLKETKKGEVKEKGSKEESTKEDKQYYTIKAGDNPWKLARQFHIKFEDLLKINQLDEEKARNLQVGDRIRVK